MIYRLLAALALVLGGVLFWCFGADFAPVGVGLAVAWLLGLGAGPVVEWANIERPAAWLRGRNNRNDRDDRIDRAPEVLGLLERGFFFAAIWLDQPLGIGAWFAFKVATKWKAWEMFGNLPDEVLTGGPTDKARMRSRVGTYINNRFLIGTLYNLLCGVAGAAAGWLLADLRRGGLSL